ncbi:BA5345 family protein [Bacillus halotolerans]
MSFETKYLIRWGIPGWMFLFWIVLNLFIQDHNLVINKIN